jgi:hypothetical protein
MLDMPKARGAVVEPRLFSYDEARSVAPGETLAVLADWLTSYPMNGHPELGRTGSVCPFVKKAALIDTLRIGVSGAGPEDEDAVFALIRGSFSLMKRFPAPPGKKRLGTIVYGFPNCASPEGLAMLEQVYRRHKYYTLVRFLMIAFFHPGCETHGLWNPDFRPMRAPIPILAVRYLIEQDAVFAAKHHLMLAPYLMRFGLNGARRIVASRRALRSRSEGRAIP